MKKMLCAATIGLLAVTASHAVTLTPTGGGGYTGTFASNVDGSFTDTFTFDPSSVAGDVKIDLTPSGPVNFFTALLNDQGFSYLPESSGPSFDFEGIVTADQPLQLQVFGFAGDASTLTAMDASYSGSITIAAVPEPAMLALLFAGLGVVTLSARRKRTAFE